MTPPAPSPFLQAEWRELLVVNYQIAPAALEPLVPAGTELDLWHGAALVSLVGFQFQNARVLGFWLPGHRNFPEVNLRFYVRRRTADGWRRGVAFIKELAPRRLVSWVARHWFGENYSTAPMRCQMDIADSRTDCRQLAYTWRHAGECYRLAAQAQGPGRLAEPDSLEEFIIEHYWGYSGGPGRQTLEYRVDHPRWLLRAASSVEFQGDVAPLYGERYVDVLTRPPVSAFLADGSAVTVMRGQRLAGVESQQIVLARHRLPAARLAAR